MTSTIGARASIKVFLRGDRMKYRTSVIDYCGLYEFSAPAANFRDPSKLTDGGEHGK